MQMAKQLGIQATLLQKLQQTVDSNKELKELELPYISNRSADPAMNGRVQFSFHRGKKSGGEFLVGNDFDLLRSAAGETELAKRQARGLVRQERVAARGDVLARLDNSARMGAEDLRRFEAERDDFSGATRKDDKSVSKELSQQSADDPSDPEQDLILRDFDNCIVLHGLGFAPKIARFFATVETISKSDLLKIRQAVAESEGYAHSRYPNGGTNGGSRGGSAPNGLAFANYPLFTSLAEEKLGLSQYAAKCADGSSQFFGAREEHVQAARNKALSVLEAMETELMRMNRGEIVAMEEEWTIVTLTMW